MNNDEPHQNDQTDDEPTTEELLRDVQQWLAKTDAFLQEVQEQLERDVV